LLTNPQMGNEQYKVNFINEFNTYQQLFSFNLNKKEYEFLIKDYALTVNNVFIACVHGKFIIKLFIDKKINTFGVNLLVRNFEYILLKIGSDLNEISNTIYYYPNFIKTLNLSDEQIIINMKKYKEISEFTEDFIKPLFTVQTSLRPEYNETRAKLVLKEIFFNK